MVTVLYSGRESSETFNVPDLTSAKSTCMRLAERYGATEAWRHIVVTDAHGNAHTPSDLWGQL